jgi:hypothetical protein
MSFFFFRYRQPESAQASSASRFRDHTQLDTSNSVGPLPENTHNSHKEQTSMPSAGFEPAIPTSERPQTHFLEGEFTRIGCFVVVVVNSAFNWLARYDILSITCVRVTAHDTLTHFYCMGHHTPTSQCTAIGVSSRSGDTIHWVIPWCVSVRPHQYQCTIRPNSVWIKNFSCYRHVTPTQFLASHSTTGKRRRNRQPWIAWCNKKENITWRSLLLPSIRG